MRTPEVHPLFSPDIIWKSPHEIEAIRRGEIHSAQTQREEQFKRANKSPFTDDEVSEIVEKI